LTGGTGEHHDEEQRGVHDILRPHHANGSHRHRRREKVKGDVLRDGGPQHRSDQRFTSAPISSGSGSGTESIHSPSFFLSWRSRAMFHSEYSYSGLQNSASNGHTSTQMPQYMQRA